MSTQYLQARQHHRAAQTAYQAAITRGTVAEMTTTLDALDRAAQTLQRASAADLAALVGGAR